VTAQAAASVGPDPVRPEERLARAGFGNRYELGRRPCVLVVDFSTAFADPSLALGMDLGAPIARTRQLLDVARNRGVPVVFVITAYDESGLDGGIWFAKVAGLSWLTRDNPATRPDPRLDRRMDEPILVKSGASAFFGTPLAGLLASQRIDTVVLTGAVTSGCIRATAIDAMQYGYPSLVPRECVGDRVAAQHEANLIDIDAKYSDVVGDVEAVAYLRGIRAWGARPTRPVAGLNGEVATRCHD